MKPQFHETVNILVQAYLNNELRHGDCEACAVGNLVHAAGYPRYNHGKMPHDSCGMWKCVFVTDNGEQFFGSVNSPMYALAVEKVLATGYTVFELARVEFAFETAPQGNSEDEWMFNGLMAVVDVLAEIHSIDLTTRDEAKLLFAKP